MSRYQQQSKSIMQKRIFKVQRQLIDDKFKHNHNYINLSGQHVSVQDAQFIKELDNRRVTSLHLPSNDIKQITLSIIFQSSWISLQKLNLGRNTLKNQGIKYLTRINLPHLTNLQLNGTHIDSFGVDHLTKGNWPMLKQLDLNENKLKNSTNLSKGAWKILGTLYIYNSELDELSAKRFLESEWPEISVLRTNWRQLKAHSLFPLEEMILSFNPNIKNLKKR